MATYSNRLIRETSPYLLQHAHNPVDWYAWGEEALQTAKDQDKPILISIGYSACHWCHVMERESFENAETADIMNEYFINIKIDREERPDLDHIYMNALQTMTGSGGWPLNVFLTPDKKPFYGGTYYPPEPMHNRPSWKQVLMGVVEAFLERRDKLETSAKDLTQQLVAASNFEISQAPHANWGDGQQYLEPIFQNIMRSADIEDGGFGAAPKFPQTFVIQYLLRYYYFTQNQSALQQAQLSLTKMIYGGLYDQLGGGFARYSTDGEWLAPHFEKMLYDNALLVSVMSEAYLLTREPLLKQTIDYTLTFVERELTAAEGGFYAALDADSEGVEGKYYVWSKHEIEEVLGADAALFCLFFDVTERGNWEHKNILRITTALQNFATQHQLAEEDLKGLLDSCIRKLLYKRQRRIRPRLDDKILLSWNALMNTAYSKAYAATGNEKYRAAAVTNMAFLQSAFYNGATGEWRHTYKNGVAKTPAFLDDYANLIQALICLQEITGNQEHLLLAKRLTELVEENFSDVATGYFYYTHQNQADVIVRTKEIYDGATPSSNAIMAWNLHYLSLIFDNKSWQRRAQLLVANITEMVVKYPVSFGMWANLLYELAVNQGELAIVGDEAENLLPKILNIYLPGRILQSSVKIMDGFPLLEGRERDNNTSIFFCKNYICQKPVNSVEALLEMISSASAASIGGAQ